MPGGAREKPDDLALYRIAVLVETESLKPVTAIKRVADELGLKDALRKRFINRLRDKYPRKKKAGTLPKVEPLPPDLEVAIDSAYRELEEYRQHLRDSVRRLTAEAEGYGFDPAGDLKNLLQGLRIEYSTLSDLVEAPPSVASAKLQLKAPGDPEAAKAFYREARDRCRELKPQIECLAHLIRWRDEAVRLELEGVRRS